MTGGDWGLFLFFFAVSTTAALAVLWLAGVFTQQATGKTPFPDPVAGKPSAFLFVNDELVEHDVTDLPLEDKPFTQITDWAGLREWLGAGFTALPERLGALESGDLTHLDGNGVRLSLHRRNIQTLVTLEALGPGSGAAWYQMLSRCKERETSQNDVLQTLTKTFSNLTTGLAIFDNTQRLTLFNPALTDLTGAPTSFLVSRPNVLDFFDRLREQQIMPEPRSYSDWRSHIREIVSQARDGLYQEVWSLPDGLTYRVTGRTHTEGAIAFLFEDISDEMAITRRFRGQVDLYQTVIDQVDPGIAVLDQRNVLFCNTAMSRLLGIDPSAGFEDTPVSELLHRCRARFINAPCWQALERDLLTAGAQPLPAMSAHSRDGTAFHIEIKTIASGKRMLLITREMTPARLSRMSPVA